MSDDRGRHDRFARLAAAVCLIALISFAAALRFPEASSQPIEHDEVYSYLVGLGFLEHKQPVFPATGHPYPRAYLHTLFNAAAMAVGGTDLATPRRASIVVSLLSILCLYPVFRHWAGRLPALASCGIFALSTWAHFRAVSARMYPLFSLFFLLVILSTLRLTRSPKRLRWWIVLVAASFASAGVHKLFLIAAPFVLVGLAWELRGRMGPWRLIGGLALVALAVGFGVALEGIAPATDAVREGIGTWELPLGNPLRNAGLSFLWVLHLRFATLPWLAVLALPYAAARRSRALGLASAIALLSGIGTTAGSEVQSAQYVFHLFPLFLGLGCAVVACLAQDARSGADTIGNWIRPWTDGLERWRRRVPAIPGATVLGGAAGGLMVVAGLGADRLVGNELSLGQDQLVLITVGAIGIAWALAWPRWHRIERWANRLLWVGVLLALFFSVPRWIAWLGPYRYPPFQREAFSFLEERLAPGDRLIVTEQLIPIVLLPDAEMAYLSQRYDDGTFREYRNPSEWVTGLPFLDTPRKLHAWLDHGGRTFVLADFRFDLHLSPEMRALVSRYPVVYRSDPAKLAGISEHPDWAGNTYEYRIFLVDPSKAMASPSSD